MSLLVLLGGPALWGATGPAHAADSLYDVAKITVDTTAKDAVAARAMGMTEAQMRAMQIMLGRVVPLTVLEQLPEFTKEEVEGLVSGVAIRSEQASTTRYIATLDVNFNPYAVQQFLANYGIPYSEERGPPISILPLMLSAEGVSSEGSVAWRTAWEELDLAHSISPATVLQPRPDLDAATVKAALAGDAEAFATMQSAYGYGGLVIAVGEIKGKKFTTRLAGEDGVGAIDFSRDDAMTGDGKTVARQAAAAALAAIENRWKTTQGGGQLPDEAAYEEGQPPPGMETEGAPAEVPRNVVALVEFSGLKDWQEIRTRLTQIAGLQALEVNALSARTASITFDFAGSLDRLQAALGQNGFALHERDGTFVLRSQ
ncbi:MAG: DUF2066 domain-containing protein [Methyloceanibacter sp.]|uniref:DUF2066 domain-containing protein n=1 Tax=Methyloceanibacter sp. TaxID=1965321 RepID=UPI003D6D28F9